MRGRLVVLVLLVGAFLCASPLHAASAQPPVTPSVEVGYSPGSLNNITSGIPVYTAGDALWVMSLSQSPYVIELSSPEDSIVATTVVAPDSPVLLYTFPASAASGAWSIDELLLQTSEVSGTIPLVVAGATSVPLNMTGYTLSSSGQLAMEYDVGSSDAYDFLACSVGSQPSDVASFAIPGALGTGEMEVALNGSNVQIVADGAVSSPFSFWVELHQDYSYTYGDASTVISKDMEVASSTAVPISGSNSTSSPLTTMLHLRPGRFTVRAFFDSATGLSAAETSVLIPAGITTWIPLSGCSASSDLQSSPLTLSSTLGSSTQTWPRQVYLMYLVEGVQMYSTTEVQVMPAALDVVASAWSAPLTDSELSFQPGTGVEQSASGGGEIFLTASQYPVNVSVSLLKGETQTVQIPSAYSFATLQVNASKLVVDTEVSGSGVPGVSLVVSMGNATISLAKSGFGGVAVFYLPPGSYQVVGTFDNDTEVAAIQTVVNGSSDVAFNFPGASSQGVGYALALIATGAAGLIASVLVWARAYGGRPGEPAGAHKS